MPLLCVKNRFSTPKTGLTHQECAPIIAVMETAGRFVIHKHTRRGEPPHWDLMFEAGDVLETYRLAASPMTSDRIAAERIFDHHIRFLTYEGSVNDGAGSVEMTESGTYHAIAETDETCRLELRGTTLKCVLALSRDKTGTLYITKEDSQAG
jgi:hypothetical protein